jgi:hypothetical protein
MYTATQITALKDERETLLNEYYKHMQTCAECFNRYAVDYGTSEPITTVCPIGAVVADHLGVHRRLQVLLFLHFGRCSALVTCLDVAGPPGAEKGQLTMHSRIH